MTWLCDSRCRMPFRCSGRSCYSLNRLLKRTQSSNEHRGFNALCVPIERLNVRDRPGIRNHFRPFVLAIWRAANAQFLDVVGSRSKWCNCAADNEGDARRQTGPPRSPTNGQRKDKCGCRSYCKSNGWCFGGSSSSSISTACSGKREAAGQG